MKIPIMTESRHFTDPGDPRLLGVDFPGVDVEVDRPTALLDPLQGPFGEPPWEDPKITAATAGEMKASNFADGNRVLDELGSADGELVG